ncbi:MAG: hypothetical protein HQL24_01590 [Candidatus Omnitrophica bacterium]|nr:hypothetical protein [Candidatus Omnitrophota bacterium]
MKKIFFHITTIISVLFVSIGSLYAQDSQGLARTSESSTAPATQPFNPYAIFDDKTLLEGYAQQYTNLSQDVLLAMIQDDTLSAYQIAAAVGVFKEKYSKEVVADEKEVTERILLRRLNLNTSPFVQVEIMHTLCKIDRYKYFKTMVPALIQKLNHYNKTVNAFAYDSINELIESGNNRPREARIIFNALRNIFFLSRKRLADVKDPDEPLKQKLNILRWSVKVLGIQELNKLPKEVLDLL